MSAAREREEEGEVDPSGGRRANIQSDVDVIGHREHSGGIGYPSARRSRGDNASLRKASQGVDVGGGFSDVCSTDDDWRLIREVSA